MKFLGALFLAATASAQYFSEGWAPGKAVTAEPASPSFAGSPPQQQNAKPAERFSFSSLLDMNKILTSEPVKGLFEKAGINITERLAAQAISPWDERIPLITDDNYFDMVVNEPMSEEEEEKRVWAIVVSATTSRQEGLSKFIDKAFDDAFNETVIADDLPHVRWARIDYLNVTYVTTKWSLWTAPSIVILQDRGQTLRFYRPSQLRVANGALREFIKREGYVLTPPWSGAFAPGGSREFVLEYFAIWMTKMYLVVVRVPRWIMFLISGSVASFAINLFHGFGRKTPPPQRAAAPPPTGGAAAPAPPPTGGAAAPAPIAPVPAAAAPASPSKAKQRKGKGKNRHLVLGRSDGMALPAKKLRLHDLVEDVLILILTECDVADVLALSATSKFLHSLVFTNTVWYPLVTKLVHRGFIDSGPDDGYLKDLSPTQLIELVKRIIRGPKSWSEQSESSSVKKTVRRAVKILRKLARKSPVDATLVESRRIVLHPEIATGPAMRYWHNKPKLLLGGNYVLFRNLSRLECWSVFEDRLVWKHKPSMAGVHLLEFNAELVEDHRAVILTCQRTWPPPAKNFVELSTLDLNTGVSNLELVGRVPDSDYGRPYDDCVVCGDIVVVYFFTLDRVLLINWRTNSRVLVSTDKPPITFIPGYLVFVRGSCDEYRLAVYPLASLPWEPNDAAEKPSFHIQAADLSIDVRDSISLPGELGGTRVWVYESPLQRGKFRVLFHTWLRRHSNGRRKPRLCSYEIVTHEAGTGVSWRFLWSRPSVELFPAIGTSLSGHILGWCSNSGGLKMYPPVPANKSSVRPRNVGFREHGGIENVHVSSFSGALTYSTDKELFVVYYD
ncbi:hypothetical protein MVEN_01195400 [Mycena venus]|uniref:F-box domain-containing protein n=1 Tax=Mycena venus TaxID=2733690 RepID=A0A8H7CXZ5_9AGAR|nr:hypothetical protein MVEN_01195400 [Mycena venus]